MHKKKVSKLEDHLGYWLRMVSNGVSQSFANKIEQRGVTAAEWVILREMYDLRDAISPSQLAHITGLTRGAVSKLIDRLYRKNLVSRYESNEDRRYQTIKLTHEAVEIIPILAEIADENDQDFFSTLSITERKSLLEILKQIAKRSKIEKIPLD